MRGLKVSLLSSVMIILASCQTQVIQQSQTVSSSQKDMQQSVTRQETTQSIQVTQVVSDSTFVGTFEGVKDGDTIILEVNGTTGTWKEIERDGDVEIKQVRINKTEQQLIVGDDMKRYYINGNQVIIEDWVKEINDDDTVILTKR